MFEVQTLAWNFSFFDNVFMMFTTQTLGIACCVSSLVLVLSIMASMPTMVFNGISSMKKLQAGGWHQWSMDMHVMLGQAEIINCSVLQPNDNTYATWSQKSTLRFVAIYPGLADSKKPILMAWWTWWTGVHKLGPPFLVIMLQIPLSPMSISKNA